MLHLPQVTLFCVYTVTHKLTLLALDECLKRASFGSIKLFTDQPSENYGESVEFIEIEPFADQETFARFVNYEFPKYIHTSHMLGFQWDGWIVNSNAWSDDFLKYDYVGAPWWYQDGHNVGNGGFCLRSKALVGFLAENEDEFPLQPPEDDLLCRRYRSRLEQNGFKWAPEKLAYQFSQERTYRPFTKSFGFHGVFNFPWILNEKRLQQYTKLINEDAYARSRPEYMELMLAI